jgi:hypothetical protein
VNSLFNYDDLVKVMKRAAVDAVNSSKPANMLFGKVISDSPLQIMVDQKLILNEAQLGLSRNVTDYDVDMTVDHSTESGSDGDAGHQHGYKGKKTFKVHNALKTGEEVVLVQVSGGQKYIVIDRIKG